MAAASVSCTLSEEQFLCSICLEVFSAPVTTPCGHSFCSACINLHWDSNDSITCPLCKQDLSSTPHLKVNTVLAEMVSQLKVTPEEVVIKKEISKSQSSAPVEVDCEVSPPVEVDCEVFAPVEVDCEVFAPVEVDCETSAPVEVDCEVSPPVEVDCEVSPPVEVDCEVSAPVEVDCEVSPPVEVDCEVSAPVEVDCEVSPPVEVDCEVSPPVEVDCEVSPPVEVDCEVFAPEEVDCETAAPVEVDCEVFAPVEVDCEVFAPVEVDCEVFAPVEVDCETSAPVEVDCEVSPPVEVDCEVSPPVEVDCEVSAPVEVDCDLCPEPRLRALKSCLVCLASYCQSHLQPHLTNPRLRRHQLIEALPNLEEHICPEHDRPLELFCRDHSHFLCLECSYVEDQSHDSVPLKKECEAQQAEVKEQIKQRLLKIEAIRGSVELSQKNADSEIQEGIRVFNAVMECVQQSLDSFKQSIEEKHRKSEEEAAQLIEKIQTEISPLEQREAEMERLWSSGDHLQFVQTFTSTKPAPPLKDWTEETVRAPSYEGRVAKAVSELERNIYSQMKQIFVAELKKAKELAVEVTLDPDTANPNLVLSKDLKQVLYSDHEKDLPDNPERFSSFLCVLGKQWFSSIKFYFEVQVTGKTAWEIGLAKESVDRKEEISQTPQNGYWLIQGKDKKVYKINEEPPVILPMRSVPRKVGVFVDYDKGLISFYNVGKNFLIYSFTDCCFTENILPLFNPCSHGSGTNSAPLILTPVAK